jgi:F-type H+/Na+-transporting ATPase subunit alpha
MKELQVTWTDFLTTRKADLLQRIAQEKEVSDPLQAELKKGADEFKATWK